MDLPQSADPFRRLVSIMARLRAKDGCPWDREQTHQTLKPYIIEEAHEVWEAIDSCDDKELISELGDLILQPVFHAQIAAEEGRFTIDDALESIVDKLIRRHPHVFGNIKADTSADVLKNWRRIKEDERPGSVRSQLDGVPKSLPALLRAQRIQQKAAEVGFDWPSAREAILKIMEEARELDAELENGNSVLAANEMGDLLFSIVNVCRLLKFDAESLLHQATRKFDSRFRRLEEQAANEGLELEKMTAEELDLRWNEAKEK